MVVNCIFHLENNQNGIFFAGQMIKGEVHLILDHPKSIRSFSLILDGSSYCSWYQEESFKRQCTNNLCYSSNRSNYGRRSTRHGRDMIHHKGSESHMHTEIFMFGTKGGPTQEMAAGTYRFPFQRLIPENAPSSFDAKHGYIHYSIEAKMDIPWKFDKEFKLQFTVARNDDLNFYPELRIPLSTEILKTFCCLCCASDKLKVKVLIPFGGFAAGQDIPIRLEYNNKSDVTVKETALTLKKLISYCGQSPYPKTKKKYEDVARGVFKGVDKQSDVVHDILFNIPAVLVRTNDQYSEIVKVTYELKLEARFSMWHRNVVLVFPIVIGSVPLVADTGAGQMGQFVGQMPPMGQFVGQMPPMGQFAGQMPPTAPAIDIPMKDGYMPVPDMEPPSFEEVEKMDSQNLNAFQPPQSVGWAVQPPSAPQEKQ